MEEKIAAAVKILTDARDCPLCGYGGHWFVDPKTGRNMEIDRRAKALAEKIDRAWSKREKIDRDDGVGG
jgi:hypothetical protein